MAIQSQSAHLTYFLTCTDSFCCIFFQTLCFPTSTHFDSLISTPNIIAADKTRFIAVLDTHPQYQYLFLRPRGWGKSTFLRTLATYYDKTKRETFENSFGELYIGKHPTRDRNSLLVLLLDFSNIEMLGDLNSAREGLNRVVYLALEQFLEANSDFLQHPKPVEHLVRDSAAESLERVMVSAILHLI